MDEKKGSPIILATTSRERDLGVIITPDLKWHEQARQASSTANRVLGLLKKAFTTRDRALWKQLYMTYVRPHLEFAVSAWCPYQVSDIKAIERVQQRATKIALQSTSANGDYNARCEKLGLQRLEERRRPGELIQFYKIQRGFDEVSWSRSLLTAPPRLDRRARFRREIIRSCSQRHNFFTNRVVSDWNELPCSLVGLNRVEEFKRGLDEWFKER